MAVQGVIVVPGPVEIGGHGADEIATKLMAIGVAHFQAGNFGYGIGLIGALKLSRQQMLFFHGLGSMFWIDARTAQEQQLLNTSAPASLDQIGLHDQVVEQEISRIRLNWH